MRAVVGGDQELGRTVRAGFQNECEGDNKLDYYQEA